MEWDNTIKIGDIITSYHTGYHRVTRIERRFDDGPLFEQIQAAKSVSKTYAGEEYEPLVYYERVLTSSLIPLTTGINCCDGSYCRKVTIESIKQRLSEIEEGYKRLLDIL